MSDETHSTGMSAFEGYTLGRLSARSQQVLGDAAEAFGRRLLRPAAPSVDVNALIAENQALHAELARVAQALRDYEWNYSKLRSWADAAEAELHGLRAKRG